MDRSRISAARPDATFVRGVADLVHADDSVLIVDASRPGVLDAVRGRTARVIAFAPHVDVELIESARRAGVEVMPRSKFFASLSSLLHDA